MERIRTPQEIQNILNNLNSLEKFYTEQNQDTEIFDNIMTYMDFLDQTFIRSNHLARMYFQQVPGDVHAFCKNPQHLEEAYVIYSGLDICIYKQFNFFNRMLHSESTFECIYILQGSGTLQLSQQLFALQEGDCIFHQPEETYLLNTQPDSIVLNINLRSSYVYRHYQQLFAGCPAALVFFELCYKKALPHNYLLFHTSNPPEFRELVLRMFGEMLHTDSYRNAMLRNYFSLFCNELKRYSEGKIETGKKISPKEQYYNDILAYLQDNYRTATLETTALTFHLSKNYISRILQANSGCSFVELLTSLRLAKAKEYLTETSLILEDIAELTGFSDASYLWRIFKKHIGLSPSEYRQQAKPY